MAAAGDNSDAMLKRFAERIAGLMEQIGEIKDEVKTELQAAKAGGLDTKALNKIVKELGMDASERAKQLEFDWTVGAYRKAVGLPTDVEQATREAA